MVYKDPIKETSNASIIIEHSLLFRMIERTAVMMHIFLVISAFLTFLGLSEGYSHAFTLTLEILTAIFIIIIILYYFLLPYFKRMYLKHYLKEIWGINKIDTVTSIPLEVKLEENDFLASIINSHKIFSKSLVDINWNSKNIFKRGLYVRVNLDLDDAENKDYFFDLDFIMIEASKGIVKIESKIIIFNEEDQSYQSTGKGFSVKIYTKEWKIKWSGFLPDHPLYGEWIIKKTSSENEDVKIQKSD